MTSLPLREQVRTHFSALVSQLGADDEVAERWAIRIVEGYSEPQRCYHTLSHVASMLACLNTHVSLIADPVMLGLAIYFHDLVYDPTRNDNELASIALYEAFSHDVSMTPERHGAVHTCIERTITHTLPEAGVTDDLKLLDFDLEVLSRPATAYDKYSDEIRSEYAHVAPDAFRVGRIKVLQSFLQRERLYFSEVFFEHCEAQARSNLQREIAALRA